MAGYKPKKEPEAWLLTADRYMAEIAEAERVEALAAAKQAKAKLAARRVPTASTGADVVVLHAKHLRRQPRLRRELGVEARANETVSA